jgi:hypothetical protein
MDTEKYMDRDQPAPPDYLITCKDKDFRRTGMRTMMRRMRRRKMVMRMRRKRRRRRRRRRKMMKMMKMTVAFRILHTHSGMASCGKCRRRRRRRNKC